MEVRYADRALERICTNEREMRRRRADIASKLRLRIKALEAAHSLSELVELDPGGRWHPMTADRVGTWAGKLSPNHRIIVRPEGEGDAAAAVVVTVVDLIDYH